MQYFEPGQREHFNPLTPAVAIWRCSHMATATEHPVPDPVKPPFVIFDIWAL